MDDAEIQPFVRNAAAGALALVERRFRSGISAGQIAADLPAAQRASQVLDRARGLTMRAQMDMSRTTLVKDAENAADVMLQPCSLRCG